MLPPHRVLAVSWIAVEIYRRSGTVNVPGIRPNAVLYKPPKMREVHLGVLTCALLLAALLSCLILLSSDAGKYLALVSSPHACSFILV